MSRCEPFIAELTVERYLNGVRIDSFLVRHFRNYTRYRMQRMVRAGQVFVDGSPAGDELRVFAGQQVQVRLIEPPDKLIEPEAIELDVVFEDAWMLVLDKPAGLVTHPVGEFQSGTLSNALQHHLDRQTRRRGLLRPGIVHRLDRQTSGVIVVSKEHLSHRRLSLEFQRSRVAKTYLALVEGSLEQPTGRIDLPIGQVAGGQSILMSARADARDAKPASTRYEVVTRYDDWTLVRAKPMTGRVHQIRVHFATIGHPILADDYYGRFGVIKPAADHAGSVIQRHALHAERIAFTHPVSKEWMEFEAPLADDMRIALENAGTRAIA